jgi:hypothetical protein
MINIENRILLAASLNLDIDYAQMTAELLPLIDHAKCIPFSYTSNGTKVIAYSLFLRVSTKDTDYSYRGAKSADFDSWSWDHDLKISYTQTVIDSMPFTSLGTVRIVYFPSIPCVEHTDWDDPTDTKHTLGLSIIPNTADTVCNVWCEEKNQYISISGNAMLLNDSVKHSVPAGNGTRITMRIFGEIDYSWFNDKIDPNNCYFLL